MGRLFGYRPSPAMVVALLALFVALAGTSYAAIKLPANSVGTTAIKNGAIHRVDLAPNAVDSARVADHTPRARDFHPRATPLVAEASWRFWSRAAESASSTSAGDRQQADLTAGLPAESASKQ